MKKLLIFGLVILLLSTFVSAYAPSFTYEINPCVSNVTKTGLDTTFRITITPYACNKPTDPWNYCDTVAIKAIVYSGDTNIQTYGWTDYKDSHQEIIVDNLLLNKTGNYSMFLYVRSNSSISNYTEIQYQIVNKTYYDSVNRSSEYVWWNNCTTTGANIDIEIPSNPISETLEGLESQYSWSSMLIWIMIMVVVGGMLWFFAGGSSSSSLVIVFIEICLLVIGTYLHFIPFWVLWLILFVVLLAAGYFGFSFLKGKGTTAT